MSYVSTTSSPVPRDWISLVKRTGPLVLSLNSVNVAVSIAYGARIKQLRINKGLTQEQLAEKMHVTGTYIVKIENSQRTGSIELAVELADCFGVSLDHLLLGREYSDKKQAFQTVIAFLSELEADL